MKRREGSSFSRVVHEVVCGAQYVLKKTRRAGRPWPPPFFGQAFIDEDTEMLRHLCSDCVVQVPSFSAGCCCPPFMCVSDSQINASKRERHDVSVSPNNYFRDTVQQTAPQVRQPSMLRLPTCHHHCLKLFHRNRAAAAARSDHAVHVVFDRVKKNAVASTQTHFVAGRLASCADAQAKENNDQTIPNH